MPDLGAYERGQGLFCGLSFTTLISDQISQEEEAKLSEAIRSNGGHYITQNEDGSLDQVNAHSHVISSHVDFPEYDECLEMHAHVVKPSFIWQSLVKGRVVHARQHSPDPAFIFQDVVVTFGDLPRGDKDAITAGVLAMGGMYSSSLTKLVTHVVSLTEDVDKVRTVRSMGLPTKVVLPHWFDDCLKLGKKIREEAYMLPDPEILKSNQDFTVRRAISQPDLQGATSAIAGPPPSLTPPPSSPGQPSTPRRRLVLFKGKKIYFCPDLSIHSKLERTLQGFVEGSDATVTTSADACDIYIGQYRDGSDYVTALRQGKIVGNLSWFYSVITRNKWSNPTNKLLHYPIPRHGIPGFHGMKITLSNYTGDARTYLENLVTVTGAEFCKTLRPENTHLVTAHKSSEKVDAAQEWGINIINHQWLEDSYAMCKAQTLTAPRYTMFPAKTNLSEIVGTTRIDMEKVQQLYLKEPEEGNDRYNTASVERKTVRPLDTGALSNGQTVDHHTPQANRSISKENEPPSSTARASKLKAQAGLDQAMKDIAEFEKERARKGGVTHSRKRLASEAGDGNNHTASDNEAVPSRPSKKVKVEEEPSSVVYRMLVTGDDRWLKSSKKEQEDKKHLRSLGILLTNDPSTCNIMVAPKILRTKKFVAAIANGPEIVKTKYLDDCLKSKILPDPVKYHLKDTKGEKRLGFSLVKAQARARENDRRLLRGWTIYVTDDVNGGFETYETIVTSNGGKAVPYRGRTGVTLPKRRLTAAQDEAAGAESQNQGGDEESDYVYLVSGESEEEVKLWSLFTKLAEKQGLEARIVKTDWLLNLAMTQAVKWNSVWEHGQKQHFG